MKVWTEDTIIEAIDKSSEATRRAVITLYRQQTEREKVDHGTHVVNNRGFNKVDAHFGSSLAEQALHGKLFTGNQLVAARKMLRKYRKQLAYLANEVEARKEKEA